MKNLPINLIAALVIVACVATFVVSASVIACDRDDAALFADDHPACPPAGVKIITDGKVFRSERPLWFVHEGRSFLKPLIVRSGFTDETYAEAVRMAWVCYESPFKREMLRPAFNEASFRPAADVCK